MIFSEWLFHGRLKKNPDLLNRSMFAPAAKRLNGILRPLRGSRGRRQRKAVAFYLAECCMAMGNERLVAADSTDALVEFTKAADLGISFADRFSRSGQAILLCSGPQ